MKVTLDRRALVAALKTVLPAVPKASGLSALTGVRIDAGADAVTFTCSNLDLTIATHLDLEAEDRGTCVVPAALLTKIVSAMGEKRIELVYEGDQLNVTSGTAVTELACYDAASWPALDTADGAHFTLDDDHLAYIARIAPFASSDQSRPMLTAIQFAGRHIAATDSYRLAVVDLGSQWDMPEALVSAEALRTVLASGAERVGMTVGTGHVTFTAETTSWTVRQIVGDYPAWPNLMRDTSPHELTFDRDQMIDAVHRVSQLSRDATIRLELHGMMAALTTKADDVGSMTDQVPADGDIDFALGFNGAYLTDLLEAMGDTVTLGLANGLKPIMATHKRVTGLLMPVRMS